MSWKELISDKKIKITFFFLNVLMFLLQLVFFKIIWQDITIFMSWTAELCWVLAQQFVCKEMSAS